MREQIQAKSKGKLPWWRAQFLPRTAIVALGIVGLVASLGSASAWLTRTHLQAAHTPQSTIATNGSALWATDTRITAATYPLVLPDAGQISVDPAFASYYANHAGTTLLGAPITPAFPIVQGWIQFFAAGALLLPDADNATITATRGDPMIDEMLNAALTDGATGIARLPLIQTLLSVGSQAVVGAGLTYVNLRSATSPTLMLVQPATASSARDAALDGTQSQAVFVPGGTRGGQTVGHLIPAVLWNYITRADVSPDGWESDLGQPLTEALPFTTSQSDGTHQMLVQSFERGVMLVNEMTLDASGQPLIGRLATGIAYLRTLGPPAVALGASSALWATGDTSIVSAPGSEAAQVHIGQHFPLTPLGNTAWAAGNLWYQVQWHNPKTSGDGWVSATTTSFTAPTDQTAYARFDVLSPDLAAYLFSQGSNAAAVVYDVTRGRYYTYNMNGPFIMGSSVKVPIMLAFLTMTEQEGRAPDDNEMSLLTTMIENSDNDSAEALFNEIGRADGLASYLRQIGLTNLSPDNDAWGYSLVTPMAMVHLLTLLHDGKVLTPDDRVLALSLMEQIESDQQVGVGDTAPPNATVAMKDGWLPGPDGLWAMNTSGIVTVGQEVYIISVYTAEQNSLDDGWAITRQVCSMVAGLLP